MRKGVQEFLLLNHPIDCPICDQAGECRLQDYYMEYGKYENRSDVHKVQKQKAVDIGPMVVLDQERCILCTRCVRFCDEISKSSELIVSGRGDMSAIETFPGKTLDNPYSGNVVDVCPVGALTSKDFRFKMRVWFMQSTKSVCTGCANGCNIFLDHKDGVTYRYRPRENKAVNDYWMCDAGRLSYKALNQGRLEHVVARGLPSTVGEAMKEAAALFLGSRPAGAIAVIGSPLASLEENFALLELARRVLKTDRAFGWNPTPDGYADDFLIKADKTPNRTGVRWLGFNDDRQAMLDYLGSGTPQVVIILNNDLAADPAMAEALRKVGTIIYIGSQADATASLATFAFPSATHAETKGSLMNHQGRVQRFFQAYEATGNAAPALRLLSHLGGAVDPSYDYNDVEDVWADLRARHSELGDLSWYGIGDGGFQVPSLVREPAAAAT
jgi:NADH-quinone oxidoreductase subunit G